ncbi:polysaccharide pyruvyl transferase family protein [Novosphingobium soli]|uniref:Polysaccharide pyruvyl transferase family protein n=1 Tax=Novosphingobium soli TaxID=574956 RepID=A0ABV6CY09_9SPHN
MGEALPLLRSAPPNPGRIVLLNVKYSPNLGDGLLSECLERELAQALPGCHVVSLDLAGRSAFAVRHGATRGTLLTLLQAIPGPLRAAAAGLALRGLVALRLRRRYRAGLRGANAVVVGGGNLFTDTDLNFPIKLSAALDEAARAGLPVAIHAVGVAPRWSRAGKRLFARGLRAALPLAATVRDRPSCAAWQAHFAGGEAPPAAIALDPGLLAGRHFPQPERRREGRKVGFCITDPRAVRYHSDDPAAATLEAWYPAALRALVEAGFEVALFTNGSPEDRAYLRSRLDEWVRRARGPVALSASFEVPADLAACVAGYAAVVAHRMHACVAAHAFGVPAIGLRWDVKLEGFFALAGRSAHLLDPAKVAAGDLGARVLAAIADPPDPAPLVARAQAEVAALARALQDATS